MDDVSVVTQKPSVDASVMSDLGEEAVARRFQPEDILCAPNHRVGDGTEMASPGGTSDAVRVELHNFRPMARIAPEEGRERFQALQKWHGHVLEVREDTFVARLTPTAGEGPEQEAELYVEEVAADDRWLIEPGAVFYWSIGYLDRPSGRLRVSILRFRRLPAWTYRELSSARQRANEFKNLFNAQ